MNDNLLIGIDSWIIQDGNYPDFNVGDTCNFAIEFFSDEYVKHSGESPSLISLGNAFYNGCGKVIHRDEHCWMLDFGDVVAYSLSDKSECFKNVRMGEYIRAKFYLGIDPCFYFEKLSRYSDVPEIRYQWSIAALFLETTPWVEQDEKLWVRNNKRKSFREISKTDAWHDDNGRGAYLLECRKMTRLSKGVP